MRGKEFWREELPFRQNRQARSWGIEEAIFTRGLGVEATTLWHPTIVWCFRVAQAAEQAGYRAAYNCPR